MSNSPAVEKDTEATTIDQGIRKSRRTRWEQTAPEAAAVQVNGHLNEPADPKAAAAAAKAMLAAKTAVAHQASTPGVATTGVLSDVAARAAAARAALEKAKRALLLKKEQMAALKNSKMGAVPGLGNASALLSAGVAAALRSLPRSAPIRFDRLGRELDEEGQVIEMKPVVHSTLKVNINREREEKLKQVTHQTRIDRNLTNPESNPWFDATMVGGITKQRKKGLCFVEKGFYAQRERKMRSRLQAEAMGFQMSSEAKEAQRQREAAEEEKLRRLLKFQHEGEGVAELKKQEQDESDEEFNPNLIPLGRGGLTADIEKTNEREIKEEKLSHGEPTKLSDSDDDDETEHGFGGRGESLHQLQQKTKIGLIPDVEWWDVPLIQRCAVNDYLGDDPDFPYVILESSISNLVEHPVPIQPAVDPARPVLPVTILTPKERAKIRRRKRQEKEKDKQDKIRMGLMAPPPPKVKLSNLARVLGHQAASDPSKMERQVRDQMAERLKAHESRNETRRLDDNARRQKTINKYTKLPTDNSIPQGGAKVCVFKVKDLSSRKNYNKVDRNAQQFHLTGVAILCPQVGNLIVAEGTHKALNGFKKLLLRRIKWDEEDTSGGERINGISDDDNTLDEHSTLKNRGNSYCRLLWEGVVKERGFKQWKIHTFKSEIEAKKLLADRQVDYYWDMLKKYRDITEDL